MAARHALSGQSRLLHRCGHEVERHVRRHLQHERAVVRSRGQPQRLCLGAAQGQQERRDPRRGHRRARFVDDATTQHRDRLDLDGEPGLERQRRVAQHFDVEVVRVLTHDAPLGGAIARPGRQHEPTLAIAVRHERILVHEPFGARFVATFEAQAQAAVHGARGSRPSSRTARPEVDAATGAGRRSRSGASSMGGAVGDDSAGSAAATATAAVASAGGDPPDDAALAANQTLNPTSNRAARPNRYFFITTSTSSTAAAPPNPCSIAGRRSLPTPNACADCVRVQAATKPAPGAGAPAPRPA